jgi:hypothetical protein
MKAISDMTQAELAAFIHSHLETKGIEVVLSGGATVCIYSNNRYVTKDIDFVNRYHARHDRIEEAMNEIGFVAAGRHYTHPDTEFYVEFPPGPLMAGDDPLTDDELQSYDTGTLRLISPTSCVKVRLAHFYHWGDRQCLEQAIMVAQANEVDIGEIKAWSVREGKLDEFDEFRSLLSNR